MCPSFSLLPRQRYAPCGRLLRHGLAVLLLATAVGCSGKGTISGKVLYKGKPLPTGTVLFWSSERSWSGSTRIHEDGSYSMEKVPPGLVKIAVQVPAGPRRPPSTAFLKMAQKVAQKQREELPKDASEMPPEAAQKGMAGSTLQEAARSVPIPDHYSDPEKSGLTCTVTSGKQEHNIELK